MDSRDPNGAVSHIVQVLRKVTRIVQLAPFVFLLLYALYLLTEAVMPAWALQVDDNLFNVQIPMVFGSLVFGHLLNLCIWYRAACLLPLTVKVEGYIDSFVITFTQGEVIGLNIGTAILFLAFLVLAYRHFFTR